MTVPDPKTVGGCEYDHTGTGLECDGIAAFILTSHKRVRPICAPMAKRLWSMGRQPCFECRKPKMTHWDYEEIK